MRSKRWYGPLVYDWRAAPFGRIRRVPPREARRWEHATTRQLAPPIAAWRDLAPQLVVWDAEGLTVPEQARRLGIPRTQLAGIRARLIREGLLVPRSSRGRTWPPEQEQQLIDLVEQGYSYDELARRFARTREAIVLKCRRLGIRITTTRATLSAGDVAVVLGKRCGKSVSRWIRLGWLTARNAGTRTCPLWRVSWDALTTFLEQPAYWLAWDPARITDAPLREWAMELRAHEPRYLTQGQVARRYHVTVEAVSQWLDKGWLPTHRAGRQNRLVAESDLVGWVPPCQRSKAGIPKAMGRRVVGMDALAAAEPRRRAA